MMRGIAPRPLALRTLALLAVVTVAAALLVRGMSTSSGAQAQAATPIGPAGQDASFTTVFKSTVGIEGLTGDGHGNLYTAGRGVGSCPVTRVPAAGGTPVLVGSIPAPCGPAGLTFNADGRLFITNGDTIVALRPSASNPPTATVFATGVPGANGVAFDRDGNLWTGDGTTGQGRVWRVGPDGGAGTEVFRVQPMVNEVNVAGGVGGIGRDPRSLPPGSVTITPSGRTAADTAGSQHLVANGLAFTPDGSTLYVADTARGAIWRVQLDPSGNLRSPVGCDTTFPADTLCLDDVLVAHPYLEGVDGIALDRAGNLYAAANERNAIVVVTPEGRVVELFRNAPDGSTSLRNGGPLEFPTSPFLTGSKLCVTSSDGARRDNFPNGGGEVGPSLAERAKINCLDQRLAVSGLPLPVG
jgi:sugar lactone lactonase YvrE